MGLNTNKKSVFGIFYPPPGALLYIEGMQPEKDAAEFNQRRQIEFCRRKNNG